MTQFATPGLNFTPEAITGTLHQANAVADDEIVTHALLVVATVRYDDDGRRVSRVHEITPVGVEVDPYVRTGLLHSVLDYHHARRNAV